MGQAQAKKLTAPSTLEELIEDAEDLLAEGMEQALSRGWTEWMPYVTQSEHRAVPYIRCGAAVEVRFRFPGEIRVEIEVTYVTRNARTVVFPDPVEWFFPELEDEQEARDTRECNDRPLKPY